MLLISAILESYRSLKDRTLKVSFETNEPTPDQLNEIGKANQKFGFLAFLIGEKEGEIQKIMESLPKQDIEFGKTKGQRLRGVIFRRWQENNKGYEIFDDYYNSIMESIILDQKKYLL